ncbi:hypothetical protein F0562_028840 [Nyssa sinensis]|uniref:GTD-binding domain-containing protein n=1 Tax=Nyssa sinensis TaxID=561372 RepID=A0A5J5B3C7_9ASTE|nr:hypothetical protein F0562_028840 [Nyssa sinensis]
MLQKATEPTDFMVMEDVVDIMVDKEVEHDSRQSSIFIDLEDEAIASQSDPANEEAQSAYAYEVSTSTSLVPLNVGRPKRHLQPSTRLTDFEVLQYGCQCRGLLQFQCDFRGKSSDMRNGVCAKNGFDGTCISKISSCKCGLLNFLKNSDPPRIDKLEGTKEVMNGNNGDVKAKMLLDDGDEQESYGEDEFDVTVLRKLIKTERQRANAACLELEKERTAAATAVEEAMAMILRLQNETSLIEMEANQFRRLAEEKQLHDQDVIQSLRWILMKHESERSLLEDQLRLCRRKLKLHMKGDEGDQSEETGEFFSFLGTNCENGLDSALMSSLDMEMSSL